MFQDTYWDINQEIGQQESSKPAKFKSAAEEIFRKVSVSVLGL